MACARAASRRPCRILVRGRPRVLTFFDADDAGFLLARYWAAEAAGAAES